jgi:hypothetical protein
MTILDIRPTEDVVPLLRKVLRDRRHNSDRERWKHRKKDGSLLDVEVSSREIIFQGRNAEVVTIVDVTDGSASGTLEISDRHSSRAGAVAAKHIGD